MDNSAKDMTCKEIYFSSDGFMLKGTLHLPNAENPPVVIGSHGLVSSGDSPKQIELARCCNAAGIAYFRFDHRGCGDSQGDFENVTSLAARCRDLRQAIRIIRMRRDLGKRMGLFGSSMGGTTALSTAAVLSETESGKKIDALVTFAAPISNAYLNAEPERPADLKFLTPEFYRTHLQFDISDKISVLHHVLIFHGDADTIVPVGNARKIFDSVGEPKKIILQENGDHRMSDPDHQARFLKETVAWFKAWLF